MAQEPDLKRPATSGLDDKSVTSSCLFTYSYRGATLLYCGSRCFNFDLTYQRDGYLWYAGSRRAATAPVRVTEEVRDGRTCPDDDQP